MRSPVALAAAAFLSTSLAFAADSITRVESSQPAGSSHAITPAAAGGGAADSETTLAPSWETQKQARTYVLQLPAPRGQITDRNGKPLAQTRVGYNLAINFPTPPTFSDTRALMFTHEQIDLAHTMTERKIAVTDEQILKHYHNRGILPLDLATDLLPAEIEAVKTQAPAHLVLRPVYDRFYPGGALAGHVLGYAGRGGRIADGPVQNNDLLWPTAEGREGIELTFNEQLTGKNGQINIAFDAYGRKASERVAIQPQPGCNVITTLDENAQRITEDVLTKGAKRGAIVIVDATNGDILAMASTPCYNPNIFVPSISAEDFKALQDDPDIPLLPRAFRSAYPPGSTFKIPVGLAALATETITLETQYGCPHALDVGNLTFHNWKKTDAGMLNFVEALTQSCDTWFYQVGIKTGADPILEWAQRLGFGVKTGIPLGSEAEGRVPTQEYMKKTYGRKYLPGDIANLSIGQGDLLVTPLQMAEAMAAVGSGTLYRARLVSQVQTYDNQIVTAYDVGARDTLEIDPKIWAALKRAMIDVVESGSGTAGKAQVDGLTIAGKTGTAQWGPKHKERDAAWFTGFVPADKPRYAFAALYEGEVGQSTHGGSFAAPMIGEIMKQLYADELKAKSKGKGKKGSKPKPVEEDSQD